jgi:hypothetical protein
MSALSSSPCKFSTLRHKYMDLRTSEDLKVFHAVIPRVEMATLVPSVDCLYLAGNAMAKDIAVKISVCPSVWWWHLFKVRGYTERTVHSLIDWFGMDAVCVVDQLMLDKETGTVTMQFANADDFLDCMEDELGSDNDDNTSNDHLVGGTPQPESLFQISSNAKASLASALNDPDMDLAANSHACAKSRCTNFISSTDNTTNCSVNTKKVGMTHKAGAIAFSQEVNQAAQFEHENCKMACCLQALELLVATGKVTSLESSDPSPPPPTNELLITSAPGARLDALVMNNDEMDEDSDNQIIPRHPRRNPPIKSNSNSPSKTCPPAHTDNAPCSNALDGDYSWSTEPPLMLVRLEGDVEAPP